MIINLLDTLPNINYNNHEVYQCGLQSPQEGNLNRTGRKLVLGDNYKFQFGAGDTEGWNVDLYYNNEIENKIFYNSFTCYPNSVNEWKYIEALLNYVDNNFVLVFMDNKDINQIEIFQKLFKNKVIFCKIDYHVPFFINEFETIDKILKFNGIYERVPIAWTEFIISPINVDNYIKNIQKYINDGKIEDYENFQTSLKNFIVSGNKFKFLNTDKLYNEFINIYDIFKRENNIPALNFINNEMFNKGQKIVFMAQNIYFYYKLKDYPNLRIIWYIDKYNRIDFYIEKFYNTSHKINLLINNTKTLREKIK